jgi:hypothetical protein
MRPLEVPEGVGLGGEHGSRLCNKLQADSPLPDDNEILEVRNLTDRNLNYLTPYITL